MKIKQTTTINIKSSDFLNFVNIIFYLNNFLAVVNQIDQLFFLNLQTNFNLWLFNIILFLLNKNYILQTIC